MTVFVISKIDLMISQNCHDVISQFYFVISLVLFRLISQNKTVFVISKIDLMISQNCHDFVISLILFCDITSSI